MPYLVHIDDFYRQKKIHSLNFDCSLQYACKSEAKGHNRNWDGPKSSFVGSQYGTEGRVPRIVFLSLDPGNMNYIPKPCNRTPQVLQKLHENDESGPRNPHWRGTHLFALRLLNEVGHSLPIRDEIFKATKGRYLAPGKLREKLTPVLPYIAHVNSAKCCANQKNGKKVAPGGFFQNCRSIAKEELAILEPDVVVSQAKKAAEVMAELNPKRSQEFAVRHSNQRIRVVTIGGREVLWIETYHPRHPKFWTEGCNCGSSDWCEYARAFTDFYSRK